MVVVGDAAMDPNAPVFRSRRGGHLTTRHAHATHALERGAPIHLVQQTLGHASVAPTGRYLHARPTESSARYLAI